MSNPQSIMIVAGEASGDLHAANLFRRIRQSRPDIQAFGMGGSKMREAGIEITQDMSELSVMGLIEVLKKYPQLKRALNRQVEIARARKPDLLILVDFQEFNKKIAKALKGSGIKVLFYVSPQIWAWRSHRAAVLGQYIDMMACIFPFELPYYEKAGVPVRFVGHPVVDEVSEKLEHLPERSALPIGEHQPVITLMPGSRRSEIERHMATLMETASRLRERYPQATFLLPVASSIDPEWLATYVPQALKSHIHLLPNQAYASAHYSDVVLVASGTATLEMAIIGTPMIIFYRMAGLSYAIISRLLQTPFVGLPNIVAGRKIVQELLQDQANADNLVAEASRILDDAGYRQQMTNDLLDVKQRLGERGASEKLAALVLEMLDQPAG